MENYNETYLSGIPITLLSAYDGYEHVILSTDLFLISLLHLHNVPYNRIYLTNDKTYRNSYFSKNITYAQLSSQLLDELIKHLNFGSMSSEQTYDYSEYDHKHQYSKLSVQSNASTGNPENFAFSINIDSYPINFYSLLTSIEYVHLPIIGLLKFISQPELKPIDEKQPGFNGWIYPDGRMLNKNAFSRAFNAFGTTYNIGDEPANFFRIPTLDSFIKIASAADAEETFCAKRPAVEYVEPHSHNITSLLLSGLYRATLSVLGVSNWRSGGATHSPSNLKPICAYKADIAFNATNVSIENKDDVILTSNSILNVDTYPNHNQVPVLMYIGVD